MTDVDRKPARPSEDQQPAAGPDEPPASDAERDRAENTPEQGTDTEDAGERNPDNSAAEDQDTGETENQRDGATEDEPALPPIEPAGLDALLDDYRDARTGRVPWNWAALPDGHKATLVSLVDRFVAAYNQWWAMSDAQLVPPCWPRHPALAYDLAAQAWMFHWAYLDERATPDRAARFQGELVPFADRLERWLGDQPDQCRAGRHRRDWRQVTAVSRTPDRDSTEYADALALLGAQPLGFDQVRH